MVVSLPMGFHGRVLFILRTEATSTQANAGLMKTGGLVKYTWTVCPQLSHRG
jgi:hypothetical protein